MDHEPEKITYLKGLVSYPRKERLPCKFCVSSFSAAKSALWRAEAAGVTCARVQNGLACGSRCCGLLGALLSFHLKLLSVLLVFIQGVCYFSVIGFRKTLYGYSEIKLPVWVTLLTSY